MGAEFPQVGTAARDWRQEGAEKRCARQLIAALDEELAAAAKATGRELVWSAQEFDLTEMLGAAVDRRVELSAEYQRCKELGPKIKLAAELRLLEGSIARLHRQVSTEVPAPMSGDITEGAAHCSDTQGALR